MSSICYKNLRSSHNPVRILCYLFLQFIKELTSHSILKIENGNDAVMTIKEAALEVMKRHDRPMTSREVYDAIINAGLYEFHSTAAPHIVQIQIRRYCEGLNLQDASPNKCFALVGNDRYVPLTKCASSSIDDDLLELIRRNDLGDQHP
ncbi:HTH domain-containing protein [Collimonas humicola]|uniref:HTH domain-containing protein n=1 Tax=Collimonas humicola TaxID=2825886 RepID=UPI0039B44D30